MNFRKYCNSLFIYFIGCAIIFVIYVNVKLIYLDRMPKCTLTSVYILLFSFFAFMMVWALIKTMITDPGKVPQNWGFFLNDPEQKKRRFCLICHIFKPERCHVREW